MCWLGCRGVLKYYYEITVVAIVSGMASWKHAVGSQANRALHAILRNRRLPLVREVPRGLSVWYDIQRLAGRREFGVILDVGANVGQTAHGLVRYFPDAEIHCFEPVSETFTALRQRYGTLANCHCLAFGAKRGEMEISTFSDPELNSFSPVRSDAVPVGSERVLVDTIDQWCEDQHIKGIDILKMDVQGWEMNVLRGAANTLDRRSVRFVLAEVGFRSRDRDMQDFGELNAFLDRLGFEFCGFYDNFRWGPGKGYLGFANALYCLSR